MALAKTLALLANGVESISRWEQQDSSHELDDGSFVPCITALCFHTCELPAEAENAPAIE
jgi:hypothetical protein